MLDLIVIVLLGFVRLQQCIK